MLLFSMFSSFLPYHSIIYNRLNDYCEDIKQGLLTCFLMPKVTTTLGKAAIERDVGELRFIV